MWRELLPRKPRPVPTYKWLLNQRKSFWIEHPDPTRSLVVGNCSEHKRVPESLFFHSRRIVIPRACEPKYLLLHLLARGIDRPAVFTVLSCNDQSSQVDLLVDSVESRVVLSLVKALFHILDAMAKDVGAGKVVRVSVPTNMTASKVMERLHHNIPDVLFVTASARTLLVLCPNSRTSTLSKTYIQNVALQVRVACANKLEIDRQVHARFVARLKACEDAYYAFATTECNIEENAAKNNIAKARLEPQKTARLQSIHEAHQAVLSKEVEIGQAEDDLAAYEDRCNEGKTEAGPGARAQRDRDADVMDLVSALPGAPAALVRQLSRDRTVTKTASTEAATMEKNPPVMAVPMHEVLEGSMADLAALCRNYHVPSAPIVVTNPNNDDLDSDTPTLSTTVTLDSPTKHPSADLAKIADPSNERDSRSASAKDDLRYLGLSLLRRGIVPFLGLHPFDCVCMCASWYTRDLRPAVLSPACINVWRSWVVDNLKPIFPKVPQIIAKVHSHLDQDLFVNVARSGDALDHCGGEYSLFSAHPVHNGRPVWVKIPEETFLLLFEAIDDLAGCWVIVRYDSNSDHVFRTAHRQSLDDFMMNRANYELTSSLVCYPRCDRFFSKQRILGTMYPVLSTAVKHTRKWFWHWHTGDPEPDDTCSLQWDSMPDSLPWGHLRVIPAPDVLFAKEEGGKATGRRECQVHIGPSDCATRTIEVSGIMLLELYPNPMRAFRDMSQMPAGMCPAHEFRVCFTHRERMVAGSTHAKEIYTAVTVTKIDGSGWTWDLCLTCRGDAVTIPLYRRARLNVTSRVITRSRSVHVPAILFGSHCRIQGDDQSDDPVVSPDYPATDFHTGRCRSLEQRIQAEILHDSPTISSDPPAFLCGDAAIELLLRLFDDDVLGLLQGLTHMRAGREVLAFGQAWRTIAHNTPLQLCKESYMRNGMMPCHDPMLLFASTFDSPTATEFMTVMGLTVDDFISKRSGSYLQYACTTPMQLGLVSPGQLSMPDIVLPLKPAFHVTVPDTAMALNPAIYEPGITPMWLKRMHGVVMLNTDGSVANVWNFDLNTDMPLTNLYSDTPWKTPLPMRSHGIKSSLSDYDFGDKMSTRPRRRFVPDKSGRLVSSHLRVGPSAPCRQLLHCMSHDFGWEFTLVDPEGAAAKGSPIPHPGDMSTPYNIFCDPLFVFGSPSFIRGNMACPSCYYDDQLLWQADAIDRVERFLPCSTLCTLGRSFLKDLTTPNYGMRRGEHKLKTRINLAVERKQKRQKRGRNKRTWKRKKKSNEIILPTKEGDYGLVGSKLCKVLARDESMRHGERYISNLFQVEICDGTNQTMFVGYDQLRGISLLRRQSLLKAAEMHASRVNRLFNLFDVDKDGALSSSEYRAYLEGIGLWGQGNYTEECWHKRWPKELEMLCGPDKTKLGILTFRHLYSDHRANNLDQDLAKCVVNIPTPRGSNADGLKNPSSVPRGARKKQKGRRKRKVGKRQKKKENGKT